MASSFLVSSGRNHRKNPPCPADESARTAPRSTPAAGDTIQHRCARSFRPKRCAGPPPRPGPDFSEGRESRCLNLARPYIGLTCKYTDCLVLPQDDIRMETADTKRTRTARSMSSCTATSRYTGICKPRAMSRKRIMAASSATVPRISTPGSRRLTASPRMPASSRYFLMISG